jgi:hypothetical protein
MSASYPSIECRTGGSFAWQHHIIKPIFIPNRLTNLLQPADVCWSGSHRSSLSSTRNVRTGLLPRRLSWLTNEISKVTWLNEQTLSRSLGWAHKCKSNLVSFQLIFMFFSWDLTTLVFHSKLKTIFSHFSYVFCMEKTWISGFTVNLSR